LALTVSGCAGLQQTWQVIQGYAITQGQLDAARSTYTGTVLVPLHKYASFPRCGGGVTFTLALPCHDAVMLKKLRNADKVVAKAFDDTQDLITSGNSSGAVAAWQSLQTAISTARGLVAAAGGGTL